MNAWFERRPFLGDMAIAVLAFVVFAVADSFRSGPSAIVVDAVFALGLVFRRRSPALALGIAWVGAITQLLLQPSVLYGNLMIAAVVFGTALDGGRRVRLLGLVSSIAGGLIAGVKLVLVTQVLLPNDQTVAPNPISRALYFVALSGVIAASLALFWALGLAVRARRAYSNERFERLESDRERLRAELRVAQETERNRISREMHDAIGHALTVVIAQSDGARYALASNPNAATDALAIINASAREALNDVSTLLTVLKGDDSHTGSLGIGMLGTLVENSRSAGLSISLHENGDAIQLSTATDGAVYRIVQESFTNALKHGGPGTVVDLTLHWRVDALELESVTTETPHGALVPVRRGANRNSGLGIAGMVERARLMGGSVQAGPRTDGRVGFRVTATVPYRNEPNE